MSPASSILTKSTTKCLNPYYSGIYPTRAKALPKNRYLISLNPYYSGICSTSEDDIEYTRTDAFMS